MRNYKLVVFYRW